LQKLPKQQQKLPKQPKQKLPISSLVIYKTTAAVAGKAAAAVMVGDGIFLLVLLIPLSKFNLYTSWFIPMKMHTVNSA
jgi:hypothetical protein